MKNFNIKISKNVRFLNSFDWLFRLFGIKINNDNDKDKECFSLFKEMIVRILSPKTIIFHGNRKKILTLMEDRPIYFSSYEVAGYYNNIGCDAFQSTKELKLFIFNIENVQKLQKILNKKELIYLKIFFGLGMSIKNYKKYKSKNPKLGIKCKIPSKKKKIEPKICTEGFLTAKNKKQDKYISSKLASILCKYGFDGWYIPEKFKRTSDFIFHEEIMICNVSKNLRKIGKCENFTKFANKSLYTIHI